MLPKTVKIESPNGSKTKTPKKQPPKSIKSRKISKNGLPMGPQGGPRTHFFAFFEPRGTPGDPQGYQRSPRRPKEASKRQFGVIFAPICIHVRPILPQICRTFRLRFSYVFPQLSASIFYDLLLRHAGHCTANKEGIPKFRATGQQPEHEAPTTM